MVNSLISPSKAHKFGINIAKDGQKKCIRNIDPKVSQYD